MILDISQLKDVAERAIATFAEVFLGLWIATDLTNGKSAAVGALTAGLAVVKGWLATHVGDGSAAMMKGGN
jgi:hypothetical protein